jgi:hypothetical protein
MLNANKNHLQQRHAAWAIGSAVKNSYDFQLWLLESDATHPSELVVKTNNKKDKDYLKNAVSENVEVIENKKEEESSNNEEDDKENKEKKEKNDMTNKNDRTKTDKSENRKNTAIVISTQNTNNTMSDTRSAKSKTENIADNNNDSNNNNNEEKLRSIDDMTGLEKLVSLLYYSRNLNGPISSDIRLNMDELQRKVFYAIAAGASWNIDVQEALMSISKENIFRTNENGVFNNRNVNLKKSELENKTKANTAGNENESKDEKSIFLNYLADVAQSETENFEEKKILKNNNSTSFELSRKVWTFIGSMLEERAFMKGDASNSDLYSIFTDLPEKAKEELHSMKLLADVFLTEKWSDLASKTFEKFFAIYLDELKKLEIQMDINEIGEIKMVNNTKIENPVSVNLENSLERCLRALLENILIVEKEILSQNTALKSTVQTQVKNKSNSFVILLNNVVNMTERKNEEIVERANLLLEILQD